MSSNIKVIDNDTKLGAMINRDFLGERNYYIEIGPEKIVLPGKFQLFLERIKNFQVRDDDVYIFAFPKSGSRWTQELVWLLLNDLDFKTAYNVLLCRRSPLLELEALFDKPQHEYCYFSMVEELKSPRCIRTHLHWSLLPSALRDGAKQPKMIVVMRNPEDTCTSYYYQSTVVEGYSGTWADFCELFLEGKVPYGPYWNHVLGFWKQRFRPNIMYINYNTMKEDLASAVRDIANFLGKSLTDGDVEKMCKYLTFDNLKNCTAFNLQEVVEEKSGQLNPFIRSGTIGDHKNKMSVKVRHEFQIQRIKKLKGNDLILL